MDEKILSVSDINLGRFAGEILLGGHEFNELEVCEKCGLPKTDENLTNYPTCVIDINWDTAFFYFRESKPTRQSILTVFLNHVHNELPPAEGQQEMQALMKVPEKDRITVALYWLLMKSRAGDFIKIACLGKS